MTNSLFSRQAQLAIVQGGLDMIEASQKSAFRRQKFVIHCDTKVFSVISESYPKAVSLDKALNETSTFNAFLLDASQQLSLEHLLLEMSHCIKLLKEGGNGCIIVPTYDELTLLPLEFASQVQGFLLRNNCVMISAQEDRSKRLLTLLVQYNGYARFTINKIYTKEERATLFVPTTQLP